jgi:UDP-glucose 4-epimerase
VFDIVDAIDRLTHAPDAIGQVFNIGSTEEISILQLAERVIERTDSPSQIQLVSYEEAYEPGFEDFRRRVPSIEKIQRVIGWMPSTPLDTTIDQMIAHFKENGLHG